MPLGFYSQVKFCEAANSAVISVDIHPEQPWILGGLSCGSMTLWDYAAGVPIDYFDPSPGSPVWSAKFVARKQWVLAGSGDKCISVYNWYSDKEIKVINEAHTAAVRCLAVHPTLPFLLSSSDDNTIKLWNWALDWCCTRVFTGHSASVVQVTFNPKDLLTFASASLDNTINIWSIGSMEPQFTLGEHLDGVLCVDYFALTDKPYLITGCIDGTAKVWDYKTKRCLQTLEGHTDIVTAVCSHPVIPIIITVSEDATVRIWHATTYRLENTFSLGNTKCFAIGRVKGSYGVVFACLYGPQMVKFTLDIPLASMDKNGTIICAKHKEIFTGTPTLSDGTDVEHPYVEGLHLWGFENPYLERFAWDVNDLLTTLDFYPESLNHSPDDKFVVVCGDGKYIIYNSSPWKVVSSGSALEFVWSSEGGYAVRGSLSHIEIFNKNFEKKGIVTPRYSAERIFGGTFLAMSSSDFIDFYDWEKCVGILRIDVTVKTRNLYWSDSGDLVAIVSDSSFKILDLNCDGQKTLSETKHVVRTGVWVMNCFIYMVETGELNYCVGPAEAATMCHLVRPMLLMVCPANRSRVYLMDEEFNLFGYTLPTSVLEYKRLAWRGELVQAREVFTSIPEEQHSSVVDFLEDLQVFGYRCETPEDLAKEEAKWIELGYVPPGTTF